MLCGHGIRGPAMEVAEETRIMKTWELVWALPKGCIRFHVTMHLSVCPSIHIVTVYLSARHYARFGGRRGEQGPVSALRELTVYFKVQK